MCIFCSRSSEDSILLSFHSFSGEALACVLKAVGATEAITLARSQIVESYPSLNEQQNLAKQEIAEYFNHRDTLG